jgi:hypothetical protein
MSKKIYTVTFRMGFESLDTFNSMVSLDADDSDDREVRRIARIVQKQVVKVLQKAKSESVL